MTRWTDLQTIRFVRIYRDNEHLWNVHHPDYRSRDVRRASLRSIVQLMKIPNFTLNDVVKKIKSLRSTYYLEMKKIANSGVNGEGVSLYTPSMKWFGEMDDIMRVMRELELCIKSGSTSHETSESKNPTASASAGSFPPTVEATDDSSSAQEYSNSAVWEPPPHPSELTQTDTEPCNGPDGYSVMDGSVSDIMNGDRPAGVMPDTLDLFGRYVASILQQLPVTTSYTLQQKFINEAISAKLEYEKEHPSKSPHQTTAASESEHLTVNRFQPIILPPRNILPEEALSNTKSIRNRRPRKSQKEKEFQPSPTINELELLPTNIKQERLDYDDEESIENADISVENCPRLNIEGDVNVVKQEIQSDFELVICNDPLVQVTNDACQKKLLQALRGEVKDKPPESTQPIICSLCNAPFSKTSDLRLHFRNTHPGVNHKQNTKRSIDEDSNNTRLTLPSCSANPPNPLILTSFHSPGGSAQKIPKLTPRPHEDYME